MTDNEQKKIFSDNLKRLLSEYGKSQAEVARYLKVSPQTFNTWIQGLALPRMGKVQALADYFRINKTDLIDEHKDEDNTNPMQGLLNEYLEDDKIRELVLFAGGVMPKESRDKYIEAIIEALTALKNATK